MWEFVSEVVPGTMNAQGGVYVWKRARARVCTYSEAGGGLVPVPRREPRVGWSVGFCLESMTSRTVCLVGQ